MYAPVVWDGRGNTKGVGMKIKRQGYKTIHHHKVGDRQYIQLEQETSLGSGAIIWGFLAAAIWMILTVVCMCL